MLIANKIDIIKNNDKLIEKFAKPKIRELLKFQKFAKSQKLLKIENLP